MKPVLKKIVGSLSICFIFLSSWSQMPADQQQVIVLKRMIERNHFSPRAIDDSFSSDVFNKIIEAVDEDHLMLTAGEYSQLESFRYKLDDELRGAEWTFLNKITSAFTIAVNRADSLVNTILQKPLEFTAGEKISFSRDQPSSFPTNAVEMRKRWTNRFKWQLLNSLYDLSLAQSSGKQLREKLAANEVILRGKIKRSVISDFQQLQTSPALREWLKDTYLSAVARSFDPHTEFFSPEEKEDFQAALSTQSKSFGFLVDEKENKLVIAHLVPGGPAWKSGDIHRNDQLLQLQFEKTEPVDAMMLSADEVSELMETSTAENLTIRIRKTDGSLKTINLRREKIEMEENSVKGFLLEGSKKIGYISLPDFYTSWDEESGSSCADDVAKEIVNLKKEQMEGLILDVRFNGGGSMAEALQLIGIFINEGPLLGMMARDEKPLYLRDPNRGTIYDGPMVVLVNGQSASASEVLAASLQDYNRAVIVGSTSYGKATMQTLLPMDTTAGKRPGNPALGFVKITTGKLYRLNGQTAQMKGVVPDIYLPDVFDALEHREKFMKHALPADSIRPNSYYRPLQPLPVNALLRQSSQRLLANADFNSLKNSIQQYAAFLDKGPGIIPLDIDGFEKWRAQYERDAISMERKMITDSSLFTVTNHGYELQRLKNNSYAGDINSVVKKKIREDIYIIEAFRILTDLIQPNQIK